MLTDVVIANKSYAKLNLAAGADLDDIALKVIRRDCPDFLLPVRAMEIDGELELRYELQEGIRLAYLPKGMKRKDFTERLVHMLKPFKDCSDWFLDYHNFVLDENYILVSKDGQQVKYVYVPAGEYARSDEEIKEFFINMILKMDIQDDMGYMVNLLRIIKNPDANLLSLLEYFQKEMGVQTPKPAQEERPAAPAPAPAFASAPAPSPAPAPAPAFAPSPAPASPAAPVQEPFHAAAEPFGASHEEKDLLGSLFGDLEDSDSENGKKKKKEKKEKPPKDKSAKGGGLFGLLKGKPKEEKAAAPAADAAPAQAFAAAAAPVYQNFDPLPIPQDMSDPGDETAILAEEEFHGNSELRLRLENCMGCQCPGYIEIPLPSGFATVGRANKNGEAQSDYNFDASVSFVSRRHFRVEKEQDHWKIVDLESSNGTYLNGERMVPNMPYPLQVGNRITIVCNKRSMTYRVC